MSKLVLREPRQGRTAGKRLDVEIVRADGNERAVLTHGDTGEELATLRVDPVTRKVTIDVNETGPVVARMSQGGALIPSRKGDTGDEGVTWEIKDGKFRCWLSNGNAVELPIAPKPGPYTPKNEHAPLGMGDMVFAACFAIATGKHSLMEGPTGIAKTTMYRWLAEQLNWNLIIMPISRGTEGAHLVGEYLPVDEAGKFEWTYGPCALAARLSATHPTLLVLDEINRIGNVQELARVYSLLDDTRMLELKEKREADGTFEMIKAGQLYLGATSNPADADDADYIGVQPLDPALASRFQVQPKLDYAPEKFECLALMNRVPGLPEAQAMKMIQAATRIRKAEEVRFPISFRELEAWALALPFYGWKQAAEVSVVQKAHPDYHASIRDLVSLKAGQ